MISNNSLKKTHKTQAFGFTLAEVLITLGIIGVVAALTIPALMNKTNDNELKQKWKKEFTSINQAWNRLKQDEGGDLSQYFSPDGAQAPLINMLGVYLPNTPTNNSVGNYYKTLSGNYVHHANLTSGQYVLRDGSQLYFRAWNTGWFLIWVDVNGYNKPPNTLGKDLFGITVTPTKFMPMGAVGTGSENTCSTTATTAGYGVGNASDTAGAGCSAKYLYE